MNAFRDELQNRNNRSSMIVSLAENSQKAIENLPPHPYKQKN
jgi:hypothetical protein